jgi:hypothetical protein
VSPEILEEQKKSFPGLRKFWRASYEKYVDMEVEDLK